MKATDLYQLVTERQKDEMGNVSYKNDKTPDNHVKNKRMKTVDPLPDKGEKKDKHPKANVGDVRGKERRSMEGPKTGVKKMAEQAPAGMQVKDEPFSQNQAKVAKWLGLTKPQRSGNNITLTVTDTRGISKGAGAKQFQVTLPNKQVLAMIDKVKGISDLQAIPWYMGMVQQLAKNASSMAGTMGGRDSGKSVYGKHASQIQTPDWGIAGGDEGGREIFRASEEDDDYDPFTGGVKPEGGYDVDWLKPEEIQAMPAGMDVAHHEPEHITMKGPAPTRRGVARPRMESRIKESGIENAGSMKKKVPVQKGGPCCKSASVRSGQKDDPKPTADVGKPKKKEKRSMDANPAPVKDWKGGSNEHKKMGMHEGIKELEQLLHRKIDTTFLEGDVDEAWDLRKAEKAAAAKSRPIATGGIKKAAEKGRKAKARTTAPGPGEEAPEGSFWSKARKHMEGY